MLLFSFCLLYNVIQFCFEKQFLQFALPLLQILQLLRKFTFDLFYFQSLNQSYPPRWEESCLILCDLVVYDLKVVLVIPYNEVTN